MRLGKQMQFFGARVNLAKALLYAINGGRDEVSGDQIAPATPPVAGEFLEYDEVMAKFDITMDWLARTYVHAMNCIHYMHDKYFYERLEMALHDRDILRTMAFGIAGLSVVADSLSAIKYGKMRVSRDATGLIVDYQNEGNTATPQFGNNDDRVRQDRVRHRHELHGEDPQASDLPECSAHPKRADDHLERRLRQGDWKYAGRTQERRAFRARSQPDAWPRQPRLACVLPVGGEASVQGLTGRHQLRSCPSRRKRHTCLKSSLSTKRRRPLTSLDHGGFHMNLNVIDKETLEDAMKNPDKYPQLTIRVSGYAVNFVRLTPEQQRDVISRTFHGQI